ncbi:ribulose-phosphate 3-epimerase [Propionispora vibrioides]|uniref:Ribulose-phosphate 3-epimerase n=1 Tax=Propionispora vibrioides TaxID=112903 RepID=A0A1H8QYG1_9FIRM|nr:ribulose-phosphate 3-epimerase [Propionispora vibrioides]SEO59116.1 ribulose-phosphate 3-epimerase [Propionispora vibrioides]
MIQIAASMMCADQLELRKELQRLEEAKVDLLHCDVMDGLYVPNMAMSHSMLEQIRQFTSIPLDIHLMIVEPERYLNQFADLQPGYISIHAEAATHLHRAVQMIKKRGIRAAVALNPSTPLSHIEYVLAELDMVLIMTVDPGYAGQKFIPAMIEKIRELKKISLKKKPDLLIQVDGNINGQTIPPAVAAGANILVGGTASIFKGPEADYTKLVQDMRVSAMLGGHEYESVS